MLAKLTDVLQGTIENKYAIPAFNVFGYEDAQAVIEAAEEMGAPVILATNKVAIQHIPIHIIGKLLVGLAEQATVPVVVHLDHGKDYETVAKAIASGYSSVMYDGSHLPFKENVRTTKEIVRMARAFGIPVEAEIGSVGYSDPSLGTGALTDPLEAKQFAEETEIDALAVAVGTLHRMEEQTAHVQFDRLHEIEQLVSVPLVMHGSTGIPDEDLKKMASTNIGKVNIGTAIRMAFGTTLRQEVNANPASFDRIDWFKRPMEAVKEEAKHKMKLLSLETYSKQPVQIK
ncbi:class II fructose-bisphosphate aldolase [Bacillus sp. REN16]|uniref:class II fructose-bisphosphate aldolase n=1 Tax=Bacillus sp. REN16 TaxID=2887296 RepID=UPI001E5A9E29|nr:class II fructose-bisphosphate aldolase [Bacillus sp. REN16]MCC3356863.1 class II fructose-bisphosphate aldolase family protein [Bacillus sp. REN16]